MKNYILLLCIIIFSSTLFAGEPLDHWQRDVMPEFFQNAKVKSYFTFDKYYVMSAEMIQEDLELGGVVVVLPAGASVFHYLDFANDLYDVGYSVFMTELRGSGVSEKLLKDTNALYVKDFSYYTRDITQYVSSIVDKYPPLTGGLSIVASSTGATVSLPLASMFRNSIMLSPVLKIKSGPAAIAISFLDLFDLGTAFASNQDESSSMFVVSSERKEIIDWTNKTMLPELTGGYSNRWINGLYKEQKSLLKKGFLAPVTILAAVDDSITDYSITKKFCSKSLKCTLQTIPTADHNLLQESFAKRREVVELILNALEGK